MLADLESYSTDTLEMAVAGIDASIMLAAQAWLDGWEPAAEIVRLNYPLRERFAAELLSRGVTVPALID